MKQSVLIADENGRLASLTADGGIIHVAEEVSLSDKLLEAYQKMKYWQKEYRTLRAAHYREVKAANESAIAQRRTPSPS